MSLSIELYPYQRVGVDWIKTKRRAGLFDEMGLGKTPQAIFGAKELGALKITVICPAIMRAKWCKLLDEWYPGPRETVALDAKKTNIRDTPRLVASFHGASARADDIMRRGSHILIIDEGHYLKDAESIRTRAVYGNDVDGKTGIISTADFVWTLTGTPAPNNPAELYPMLRANGIAHKSYEHFLNMFCVWKNGPYGPCVFRGKNLDALRQTIEPFFLRRFVKDEVPPLHTSTTLVDPLEHDGASSVLANVDDDTSKLLLEACKNGNYEFEELEHIATIRRAVGLAKVPGVVRMVSDELMFERDKIVLACQHKQVMDAFEDALNPFGFVSIRGGGSEKKRQKALLDFDQSAEHRVAIVQMQAGATGVDMVAADKILLVEPSWCPADNKQIVKRIHRIGQKNECYAQYIALRDSLDQPLNAVIRRKDAMVCPIFG